MNWTADDTDQPVAIITTGGTIDKVYFDASSDYEVGDSVVAELLNQAQVHRSFAVISLLRKDSLDLTDEDRRLIASTIAGRPEAKVVVTHGTDTMTQTAQMLLGLENKTVVLTGSLAPARFAQSDAVFNIGMAFAAVQTLASGVYIVMNGQVFAAGSVRKDKGQKAFVQC